MKKICFSAIALVLSVGVFAQSKGTHELRFTAGTASTNGFIHGFRQVVNDIFTPDELQKEGFKSTPVLALQYRYSINSAIVLNVEGVYEYFETVYNYPQISSQSDYITIGTGVDWAYFESKGHSMGTINLYSGLNVAYTMRSSSGQYFTDASLETVEPFTSRGSWANGHLTLLGFRAGNALGVNVELGFGYRGILNGGVSFRF